MNKSTILIIAVSLMSLQSHASWYSGINFGASSVSVQKDLIYPINDPSPTSSSFSSNYTGFHAQLLAGYELFVSNKLSTLFEANADMVTGKAQSAVHDWYFSQDVHAKEELKYGFSLYFMPALKLNETTRIFIGPGYSRSQFHIDSGETAGNIGVTGSFNSMLTGVGFKTGIITKLTNTLDVLFTYQFTQYNSATWANTEPLSDEELSGRYKPHASTVLIGLRVNIPESAK